MSTPLLFVDLEALERAVRAAVHDEATGLFGGWPCRSGSVEFVQLSEYIPGPPGSARSERAPFLAETLTQLADGLLTERPGARAAAWVALAGSGGAVRPGSSQLELHTALFPGQWQSMLTVSAELWQLAFCRTEGGSARPHGFFTTRSAGR